MDDEVVAGPVPSQDSSAAGDGADVARAEASQFPLSGGQAGWRVAGLLAVSQLSALPYAIVMTVYLTTINRWPVADGVRLAFDAKGASSLTMFALAFSELLLTLPVLLRTATFPHWPWQKTLAVVPVAAARYAVWAGLMLLLLVFEQLYSLVVERQPEAMVEALNGSRNWGFAFLAVVTAPIVEEGIFRGYAFTAWRHTRLGLTGTLLLTTSVWTLAHLSVYRLDTLALLFAQGLLFGFAREKTGSVLVPMLLHALNNALVVVVVVYLGLYSV